MSFKLAFNESDDLVFFRIETVTFLGQFYSLIAVCSFPCFVSYNTISILPSTGIVRAIILIFALSFSTKNGRMDKKGE